MSRSPKPMSKGSTTRSPGSAPPREAHAAGQPGQAPAGHPQIEASPVSLDVEVEVGPRWLGPDELSEGLCPLDGLAVDGHDDVAPSQAVGRR